MSDQEIRTDRPILVFGAGGQVGRELVALDAKQADGVSLDLYEPLDP